MIVYVDTQNLEKDFEIIKDTKKIDLLKKMYSLDAYQ